MATPEYDVLLQVLKEARLEKKMSQEDLSLALGRSVNFINLIERGSRRVDPVEVLEIAQTLGLHAGDLFAEFVKRAKSAR